MSYCNGDDLRDRIAAVLRSALLEIDYSSAEKSADGEQWVFIDGTVMPDDLADAVIAELRPQLAAWARLCVDSGDMTPMAQRLLRTILGAE